MKKNRKKENGFSQLKPGELPPRPPDRPRTIPKGPIPPPQIVFIESGTSLLPPQPAPRRKKPRHGKR
jgi:hypothetical protein